MGRNTPDGDNDTEHINRRQFSTRSAAVGAALGGLVWIPSSWEEFLFGPDPAITVEDPELVIEDDVEDCTVSAERDGTEMVLTVEGRVSRSAIGDTLVIQLMDETGIVPRMKTRDITSQRFSHTIRARKINDFDRVRVLTR